MFRRFGFRTTPRAKFAMRSAATAVAVVTIGVLALHATPARASDGAITIGGNVKAKTCTVTTSSVVVKLKAAALSDFSGLGSIAPGKDFTVGLDCTDSVAQVYLTLTDGTSAANRTDVLSLTAAATAKGVGLQIVRSGGSLVKYGPDSAAAGNTNQFFVSSAVALVAAGNEIPFTARYVKTESLMVAGSVHAIATFTLSYQ